MEYIKISDLSLIATVSLSVKWENFEINNRRGTFFFPKTPAVEYIVDMYWKDEYLVEPKKFFNQLKHIKNLLNNAI